MHFVSRNLKFINVIILRNCLVVVLSVLLMTSACKKEDNQTITQKKITGKVQKGPYINGNILLSELHPSLDPAGKDYLTKINNKGFFTIDHVSFSSQFIEFSASGDYFNEISGSISCLNLFALADIKDISSVNVNIMTHLEIYRVEYLVVNKKYTFIEAKDEAQEEILAVFGFQLPEMNNSEMLDITINKDENAILLAISIILQGNRSQGELMDLFENIRTDVKEDGILNDESILADLRNSTIQLNLSEIRTNLEKQYEDLGINATIPNFEKYINSFLIYTERLKKSRSWPFYLPV